MRDGQFEWNDAKAQRSERKHGVTFVQAREAFDDVNALEEPDDDPDEDRWKLTGKTTSGIVVVIYTERGKRTRIISARKATAHEQALYQRQTRP
jgi:uncharacterized protein